MRNNGIDADNEIATQASVKNYGAVCERKSNISLQFELGPPNESFTGKLEVCILLLLFTLDKG